MKIAIYAENVQGMAGRLAWTDSNPDYDESWDMQDDVDVYEAETVEDMVSQADEIEANAPHADAGRDVFLFRVARTLRENA